MAKSMIPRLRSWWRALGRGGALNDEARDEMRLHMDLYAADLIRGGLTPEEARRRAGADFGSSDARIEECRQALGLRLIDEGRNDLRYAGRVLRSTPGFTIVAVLSLALGIGANTAIFSLVDTVLLKRVPVARPDRLFFVDNTGGKSGGSNGPPYPAYEILRDHGRYMAGLATFEGSFFKVAIDESPEQMRGQYVSSNYFDVLGLAPAAGRLLRGSDESRNERGGPDGPVAVISYELWQNRFGGEPSTVGRTIGVGQLRVTIVGVAPRGFRGLTVGAPIDLSLPMGLSGSDLTRAQSWWFSVIGRLKDDASIEQARADLDALFQKFKTDNRIGGGLGVQFNRIELVPAARGLDELRRELSRPLLIVMAIVALVLLIGCANVANLLLARASARRAEISLRLAIGASRARIIRQLLTEGAVLTLLGAGFGLLFASWAAALLASFLAGSNGRIELNPVLDIRALAFTTGVAVITGLLFSLVPALRATRTAQVDANGGRASMAAARARLGQALVVAQVAIALVLLGCAGLFVRTLSKLNALDAGFSRNGVLLMTVSAALPRVSGQPLPEVAMAEMARVGGIWQSLVERMSAEPGVDAVAAATLSPLSGRDRGVRIVVVGGAPVSEAQEGIHLNHVTAGYFDVSGLRLLSGRGFTDGDRSGSLRVAILNQTAAREYFGSANPVGWKVKFVGSRAAFEYEIVGVVNDSRYESLRKADERMVYLPLTQPIDRVSQVFLAIRGSGDAPALLAAARNDVRAVVPGGFVVGSTTMAQRISDSLVQERMVALLATAFGVLALALACIGLYGVFSYVVTQRTREIGIRMAVGAQRASVVWLILRETLLLLAIGIAVGLPLIWLAGNYVESQLFGVMSRDALALSSAVVILGVVATAAAMGPAFRASRVNPIDALRSQ